MPQLDKRDLDLIYHHAKCILNVLDGRFETPPQPEERDWKSEPATEKQYALLDLRGVEYEKPLTKGEASELIDKALKKGDNPIE